MKTVFSVAVPALLLMSAAAFAADSTTANMQPSGGQTDQQLSAGTGGLQGSVTGAGNMNGPNGDGSRGNGASGSSSNSVAANSSSSGDTMTSPSVSATSELSASADTSPTYQGGRRAYRGKSEHALNASEAQETAQLNQEQSQFSAK